MSECTNCCIGECTDIDTDILFQTRGAPSEHLVLLALPDAAALPLLLVPCQQLQAYHLCSSSLLASLQCARNRLQDSRKWEFCRYHGASLLHCIRPDALSWAVETICKAAWIFPFLEQQGPSLPSICTGFTDMSAIFWLRRAYLSKDLHWLAVGLGEKKRWLKSRNQPLNLLDLRDCQTSLTDQWLCRRSMCQFAGSDQDAPPANLWPSAAHQDCIWSSHLASLAVLLAPVMLGWWGTGWLLLVSKQL